MPLCLPRLEGISPEGTRDASKESRGNVRTTDGRCVLLVQSHDKISAGEESRRGMHLSLHQEVKIDQGLAR
jgi:hypothetical protein